MNIICTFLLKFLFKTYPTHRLCNIPEFVLVSRNCKKTNSSTGSSAFPRTRWDSNKRPFQIPQIVTDNPHHDPSPLDSLLFESILSSGRVDLGLKMVGWHSNTTTFPMDPKMLQRLLNPTENIHLNGTISVTYFITSRFFRET